jgi:hypothetical protein
MSCAQWQKSPEAQNKVVRFQSLRSVRVILLVALS